MNMNKVLKVALTAACVGGLAWPLLFWGKPALPESRGTHAVQARPSFSYTVTPRQEVLW